MSILSVMESCFTRVEILSQILHQDYLNTKSIIDFDAEINIFVFCCERRKFSCSDVALIQLCKANYRIKVSKFTHRQRNHVLNWKQTGIV